MMNNKKGFSLLELMVTVVLIGIVSTLAISTVFRDLPAHQAKNGIITVEQALKTAKSIAAKISETVTVDFALASSNNGDKGGIIQLKDSTGAVITIFALNKNVQYNAGSSTIVNNKVIFDFRGQPVDATGDVSGFDTTCNTIAISYKDNGVLASETIRVNPLTGSVDVD
ncbi:MAG: hypothetical protein A2Y25_04505 [Candidatus Melainabacteria bacterium GWF2_37_15]|nr:MAG: hypothetical protein A2Y25_04505 [Candidatus Melainabacteria bacterium GWF2_37_15]